MPDDMPDEQLMLAYANGDAAAFDLLYARHEAALYRFVRRLLGAALSAQADEVFQDAWLRIVAARASFQPQGAAWRTWAFTIAHNAAMDRLRVAGREVSVHHEDGTLELVFPSPYLMNAPTVLTSSSLDGTTEIRTVHRDVSEAFERQLEAFHALATEGTPPLTGLTGGLADIVTAQKIIKSVAGPSIGGEAHDA